MFECCGYDQLLKWDPADHSGLERVRVFREDIWTPDVLPYNDVRTFDHNKFDIVVPLTVHSDGKGSISESLGKNSDSTPCQPKGAPFSLI